MQEKIINLWNEMAKKNDLPKLQLLTDERKRRLNSCIKLVPSLNDWINIINEVPKNDFRLGHNDRKWKANFDWLINTKSNFAKMLEDSANSNQEYKGKENAKVASRFNKNVGYTKTVGGVSGETTTRAIGDILKGIL